MPRTNRHLPQSAAILTIKCAADMTPRGRKAIAAWLRQQADHLQQDGAVYGPRFTARYLYT